MKYCPACTETQTNDAMRICPFDGTPLLSSTSDPYANTLTKPTQDSNSQATSSSALESAAILSPRNTIIDEWKKMELSIVEAAGRYSMIAEGEKLVYPAKLVNKLHEAGKINDETRGEFFTLNKWYDNVAIYHQISSTEPIEAISFANKARALHQIFETV